MVDYKQGLYPSYDDWKGSENKCNQMANSSVKDVWGDHCLGSKCLRTKDHNGMHMASDGANGFVNFTDKQVHTGPIYYGPWKNAERPIVKKINWFVKLFKTKN